MARGTRDSGNLTKHAERASSGTSTETYSKANGRMIKPTGRAFIFIRMERGMRATGKTISNMASERKYGPTAQNTRDITLGERSMERDCICGRMDPCTKANGSKIE